MKEQFFKLNLNGCKYWQSEIVNGQKIFNKKEYVENEISQLNYLFLKKIGESKYIEISSNTIIEFENDEVIKPKGIVIPLSNITPCSQLDILSSYKTIRINNLISQYKKNVHDMLAISKYCEIVREKKENSLSLYKRY